MKLPQLSLRELFLLVALVAMGCGWWVDRQRIYALRAATTREALDFALDAGRLRSEVHKYRMAIERAGFKYTQASQGPTLVPIEKIEESTKP